MDNNKLQQESVQASSLHHGCPQGSISCFDLKSQNLPHVSYLKTLPFFIQNNECLLFDTFVIRKCIIPTLMAQEVSIPTLLTDVISFDKITVGDG